MSKSKGGVSKTARASLRTTATTKVTRYPILVVESYEKPNGAIGLRRRKEWRETGS